MLSIDPHDPLVKWARKLEPVQFVHVYTTPAGTVKVTLPRYRLSFESDSSGALVSLDHRGFRLATCQQLRGTMHGFGQYILLEPLVAGCEVRLSAPCMGEGTLGRCLVSLAQTLRVSPLCIAQSVRVLIADGVVPGAGHGREDREWLFRVVVNSDAAKEGLVLNQMLVHRGLGLVQAQVTRTLSLCVGKLLCV